MVKVTNAPIVGNDKPVTTLVTDGAYENILRPLGWLSVDEYELGIQEGVAISEDAGSKGEVELTELTFDELTELAKAYEISIPKQTSKKELIKLLEDEHQEG